MNGEHRLPTVRNGELRERILTIELKETDEILKVILQFGDTKFELDIIHAERVKDKDKVKMPV